MQETNDTIALYPSARQERSSSSMYVSVTRFARILRRSWLSAMLVFLALFLPMLLVALQQPILYSAQTKVLLESERRVNLEMSTALASKERERVLPIEKLNSQAEILKSTTLLLDLVRKLNLAQTTEQEQVEVKRLQKQIRIRVIPTSSVISISYAAPDPVKARNVVNTLATIYLGYYLRLMEGENLADMYQKQYDFSNAAIQQNMQSLIALQSELGIVDRYEPQHRRLTLRLTDLRARLEKVALSLSQSEQKEATLSQQLALAPETVKANTETIPNPEAMRVNKDLSLLTSERDALLTRYTERHPAVVRKTTEIATLKLRVRQIPSYVTGESNYIANPRYEKLWDALNQNQNEIGQLTVERSQLQKDVAETSTQLVKLEENAFRLTSLEDAVDANSKARQTYQGKLVDARLVDTMNREQVLSASVIDDALVATPADMRSKSIAASFALSALIALGFVFLRDWRQPRLNSPDELRALLQVPVLATISDASKGRSLVADGAAKDPR